MLTKKLIALFMVLVMGFSLVVECCASPTPVLVTDYFEEQCVNISGDELLDSFSGNMPQYFNSFSLYGSDYSSYSLLSDLEKVYYDKIVSLDVGVLSFKIEYSPALSKQQFQSIDFSKIMNAVCLDHPEIFYYNGYSYIKSYYPSTGAVVSVTYNVGVKKHSQTNTPIYNSSNICGYYDAMMNVINSLQFDSTTRYDFLKSLHDYLCNNIAYVNDYASCFDAYGALVNGKAVCQGYAETFKLICDIYKIPCVCISGTANGDNHMWNAIQMDDGKWYLLDVTWDDQDTRIYNDFFLVGLQTKDTYFTGKEFNVSHVSDGSPYLPLLPYSDKAFNSADKFSGFNSTYNARADLNNKEIILSFFDTKDNNIYFNGMYVAVADYYTTARFLAPTGKNNINENWKMILIGDCNGDGFSDSADYNITVEKALQGAQIETDYDVACDADSDGVIDALDVAILERAISGANEKIIIE